MSELLEALKVPRADAEFSYLSWRSFVRDAEDVLVRETGQVLDPHRAAIRATSGADLVGLSTRTGMSLVLEVKVWRDSPKNLANRVEEALSQSVLLRRQFRGDWQLGLLALFVASAESQGSFESFAPRLTRLLRTFEHDAGFDGLVAGWTDGSRLEWHAVHAGAGWVRLADFKEATRTLTNLPVFQSRDHDTPGEESSGDVERSPGAGRPAFLLVGDEWRSARGGVSTFNRELAIALARAGCEVRVVVPEADQAERDETQEFGLGLATPVPIPGLDGSELLLTPAAFGDSEFRPDIIVGHGRVLGPYAYAIQNQFFPDARRVHFVHTDAESLELVKDPRGNRSAVLTADKRRRIEADLSISADLVAGVGPVLADMIRDSMRGFRVDPPQVIDFRPGLRDWEGAVDPTDPPKRRQVLLIARADDVRSKGIDIAARAVALAVERFGDTPGESPVLVVRGVPDDDADNVRERIESFVAPQAKVYPRPYSTDVEAIRQDLWQSRVVVMPSRHEGFGLVALEAIAAGVPVLVSRESGVGRMLEELLTDGDRRTPREVLSVAGPDDEIAAIWGEAVYDRVANPVEAFARAANVRDELQAAGTTWPRAVKALLDALKIPAPEALRDALVE